MLVVVARQGSLSFRCGRRRAVPFDDFLFHDPIFCFTPACRGHEWRWSGRGCVGESGDVWENQGDDGGVWLDRRRRDSPQLRHPASAGGSFARTRLSNQLIGCFGLLVETPMSRNLSCLAHGDAVTERLVSISASGLEVLTNRIVIAKHAPPPSSKYRFSKL